MNAPGLSLFQGGASIHIDTSAQQRIEEEDALEDRKRRDAEINNELQNAFDDLIDDDDDDDGVGDSRSSINISMRRKSKRSDAFQRYQTNGDAFNQHNGDIAHRMLNGTPNNGHQCNCPEHEQLIVEIKYLKNAINSKEEEVKNITLITTSEKIKFECQIDELKKRLSISEAEKERAHMTRKQTHELVVESKQKIAEQESEIVELNVKLKSIDKKNLELLTDLEHTRTMLNDVQHKYHMVEKSSSANAEQHADGVVRQLNGRHLAQVEMMQQQINTLTSRVEGRDNELKKLRIQNTELHNSRETLLIDKSDTINRLTQQLDEAQRQCQSIISMSANNGQLEQEVLKLRRMVNASEQQMDSMQRTISNLTSRLENTTAELELITDSAIYEDSSPTGDNAMETPRCRPKSTLRRRSPMGTSSTPIVIEDRLQRLKQELNRCLVDQREKRMEILQLKEQLILKDNQIEQLKIDENAALVGRNTSKETAERMAAKLKLAESELASLKKNPPVSDLKIVNGSLNFKNTPGEDCKCAELTKSIEELTMQKEKLEQMYQEVQDKNKISNELLINKAERAITDETTKENAQSALLKGSQDECYQLKNLYMNLSSEKDDLVRELAQLKALDVNKELGEQKNKVVSLEKALSATEAKCAELSKLMKLEKESLTQKIEELKAKCGGNHDESRIRRWSITSCTKCIEMATKIAQTEIENLQIQSACTNYLKEIHELKKTIKRSDRIISDLEKQSVLKTEHDRLIDEMKKKAEQFEKFMRTDNNSPVKMRDVETNTSIISDQSCNQLSPDHLVGNNGGASSNDSPSSSSTEHRAMEKRIREEMSKVMAQKIKAYENQIKEESRRFEQQMQLMSEELEEAKKQLQLRDRDVSALKQCILSERATVQELFQQKDHETETALDKQNNMLIRARDQLESANRQIGRLSRELDDCTAQIGVERHRIDELMRQWNEERKKLNHREEQLKQHMIEMRSEFEKSSQELREKINAAKRTAASYKQYAKDQDQHIVQEAERMKKECELTIKKIKDSMVEKEKQLNLKFERLKTKYDISSTSNSGSHRVTTSGSERSNSVRSMK